MSAEQLVSSENIPTGKDWLDECRVLGGDLPCFDHTVSLMRQFCKEAGGLGVVDKVLLGYDPGPYRCYVVVVIQNGGILSSLSEAIRDQNIHMLTSIRKNITSASRDGRLIHFTNVSNELVQETGYTEEVLMQKMWGVEVVYIGSSPRLTLWQRVPNSEEARDRFTPLSVLAGLSGYSESHLRWLFQRRKVDGILIGDFWFGRPSEVEAYRTRLTTKS